MAKGAATIKGSAVINAEKRSNLCSKTPGRVKFSNMDNESLKESGGGGGGGGSSSSSVSPSKKLKKSSSSGGSGGSSSSGTSSKQHHHHNSSSSNHHHSSRDSKPSSSSSSSVSSGQKASQSDGPPLSTVTTPGATATLSYEKGANVGYNLFAKLRDLYVELKAETSPRMKRVSGGFDWIALDAASGLGERDRYLIIVN